MHHVLFTNAYVTLPASDVFYPVRFTEDVRMPIVLDPSTSVAETNSAFDVAAKLCLTRCDQQSTVKVLLQPAN